MKYKKKCQRLAEKQAVYDKQAKTDANVAKSMKRPGSVKKC